jgi:hypothetical protein
VRWGAVHDRAASGGYERVNVLSTRLLAGPMHPVDDAPDFLFFRRDDGLYASPRQDIHFPLRVNPQRVAADGDVAISTRPRLHEEDRRDNLRKAERQTRKPWVQVLENYRHPGGERLDLLVAGSRIEKAEIEPLRSGARWTARNDAGGARGLAGGTLKRPGPQHDVWRERTQVKAP